MRLASGLRAALASHAGRLSRFLAVGLSGVLVNFAVLYSLVQFLAVRHIIAVAVATETAIATNFMLNDSWTFARTGQSRSRLHRALSYNGVSLVGLAVSLLVFAVLNGPLRIYYLLANLAAIGAATVWNYFGSLRLAWRS